MCVVIVVTIVLHRKLEHYVCILLFITVTLGIEELIKDILIEKFKK